MAGGSPKIRKMNKSKVIILTGDKLRHKYFALKILQKLPQAKLIIEKQPLASWGAHLKSASPLMEKHFNNFASTEEKFFSKIVKGHLPLLKRRTIVEIDEGDINSQKVIEMIKKEKPVLLIVLSTSLLKDNFINSFPQRTIINLHAGLSPYYRGSGTNVFPFYYKKLEYVGMTVHYLDRNIDSGEIILQGRPKFQKKDNTHTIGCKNVILGTRLVLKVISFYLKNGPPQGKKQELGQGKLYFKKDFSDGKVKKIYQNIDEGLVKDYLKKKPKKVKMIEKINHE